MAQLPPRVTGPLGTYQVAPEILLNGTRVPAITWNCDINAYSMSSLLECTIVRGAAAGFPKPPHFGVDMQKVRPYPFEIRCGFSRDGRAAPLLLEKGYVDERHTEYGHRLITFSGRGTASIFQDIQIGRPINKHQAGSDIIKGFFQKYGIPLNAVQSPTYAGSTGGGNDDPAYQMTMRDRTIWDEMQAIALGDGYRLTVHGGVGAYAPITGNDPVLMYDWAGGGTNVGLVDLSIRHSPRRSHNVKVVLRSSLPHAKASVFAVYGSTNAADGETFNVFQAGLKRAEARMRAQQIWGDIARRELLATAVIAPDLAFMQMLTKVGANFQILLGGDIDPSERLLYSVRQVRLECDTRSASGLPLRATVVMGNLHPAQEGAFLS
jgi:hypothetical protein